MTSITIPNSVTSIATNAFNGCNSLTIFCYPDSYAHQYAIAKSIKYSLIEAITLLGDIDCDGEITISDTNLLLRYIRYPDLYPLTDQGLLNAKVIAGDITISNVNAILNKVRQGDSYKFPIEL